MERRSFQTREIEAEKLTAEIEAEWDGGHSFRFWGIESFTELQPPETFPVLLATEKALWPWEYDRDAFPKDSLAETLQVNSKRKRANLAPFWK